MYPRLVHIYGPLWIQSYGFMIVFGLLVFLVLTYHHPIRKRIIAGEVYLNAVFTCLVAGIVGGRILFIITEWSQFSSNWLEVFYPWTGGFAILGAILGILITAPIYFLWHRVPILPILDLAAVYAPLMQALGRVGCFLAGCCYGRALEYPAWWSVTFTHYDGYLPLEMIGVPLYPTQLYACFASLAIFFIMYGIVTRYCKRNGQWITLYLVLENAARFVVDFWRADQAALYRIPGVPGLLLSDMQLLALVLGSLGLLFFCIASRYGSVRQES